MGAFVKSLGPGTVGNGVIAGLGTGVLTRWGAFNSTVRDYGGQASPCLIVGSNLAALACLVLRTNRDRLYHYLGYWR